MDSSITTKSWVYLFSKFTHEAMLFEALALFLGVFGYAVFYLIRKRKYGVAGKEIESSLVKVYLAQLVADAEEMRTQLFGLLGKGEASAKLIANLQFQAENLTAAPAPEAPAGAGATAAGAPTPAPQTVQDPKAGEKMKELEKKLAEQAAALDSVLNEKMKLEEELANAKASDKGPGGGGPDKSGALNERVKQLESQLAEYAIIEDDLANLKRLQKENKTLKQQLADVAEKGPAAAKPAAAEAPDFDTKPAGGEKAPAAAAAPADAKPAATAEAPNFDTKPADDPKPADPKAAAAPEVPDLGTKAAAPDVAPAKEAAPAVPDVDLGAGGKETAPEKAEEKKAAAEAPDLAAAKEPEIATEAVAPNAPTPDAEHAADFEALVDVVEKNLAETGKSENMAPHTAENPDFKLESGPAAETKPDEKSEEQLQADFEKMLNS